MQALLLGLMAVLAMRVKLWELSETLIHRRVPHGISTKSNLDSKTLLQCLDPSRKNYGSFVSPMMRLGWEYLRSVRQMPLEQPEKLFCYATALSVWYVRQFRNWGGRYKRRLFGPAGVSVTG